MSLFRFIHGQLYMCIHRYKLLINFLHFNQVKRVYVFQKGWKSVIQTNPLPYQILWNNQCKIECVIYKTEIRKCNVTQMYFWINKYNISINVCVCVRDKFYLMAEVSHHRPYICKICPLSPAPTHTFNVVFVHVCVLLFLFGLFVCLCSLHYAMSDLLNIKHVGK